VVLVKNKQLGQPAGPEEFRLDSSLPCSPPGMVCCTDSEGARLQVSLRKNVNSCCATGPFISEAELGAALCSASLPAPSTLYGLSVLAKTKGITREFHTNLAS
jgi:hypothetical protein